MNLFDEIRMDILGSVMLSSILRKAKVLAYSLKNQDFKDWIEHELNGYGRNNALPEYRKISTESHGNFVNSAWKVTDAPIPTNNIPEELREVINNVEMTHSIGELESLIETMNNSQQDTLQWSWPANFLLLLNGRVYAYMSCIGAWRVITKGHLTKIIENTRNRIAPQLIVVIDTTSQLTV